MERSAEHQHALDALDKGSSVRLDNGEVAGTKAEVDAHFSHLYPAAVETPSTPPAEPGLEVHTVAKLKELAAELGLTDVDKLNKAKLIEAVTAALEAKEAAEAEGAAKAAAETPNTPPAE